jgi:hypothetical protein
MGSVALADRSPGGEAVGMKRYRSSPASALKGSAFAGYRFPPEVIILAVRWYLRFGLSNRDLEEILTERGIEVDHVSLYRWVQRSRRSREVLVGAHPIDLGGQRVHNQLVHARTLDSRNGLRLVGEVLGEVHGGLLCREVMMSRHHDDAVGIGANANLPR